MVVPYLPVADVVCADDCIGFAGSGALCCSLHDDRLHQSTSPYHLQSGSSHFWCSDRGPADQVSIFLCSVFIY